ncbi:Bax inhibitor-1/YccA family protein [Candidatus Phytoplasma solani]|uniref:Bax inhibitor-1/YccA family membrane protein n=1 Tax=Candidatus Phytoplasma solani TaxID=69896 RepID=UPI00358EF407
MKSNNNIMKVSDSFEKINNNFLSFSDTIAYKQQATRKGIAFKTILLLLITTLTTIGFFTFFNNFSDPLLKNFNSSRSLFYGLLALSVLTSYVYTLGMNQVQTSNIFACLFAFLEGFMMAICFYYINKEIHNLLEIVFIAALGTVVIFCLMAHAYYKGVLKVTDRFKTIMQKCAVALFCVYIVRLLLFFLGIGTIENVLYNSIIAIPLSLIMLGFLSLYLALHFDYTENMIQQGLPAKYEWQVSLAFAATLIAIFLRIVSLLLRIIGKDRK